MAPSHSKDSIKINELLDKLRTMAERGEKNERIIAQIKLEDLLRKYNILGGVTKNHKRIIKVNDWLDHKNLLLQCIVDTKPGAVMEGYKSGKRIIVELNELEYILVCEKLEFYWREYIAQKAALFAAFVIKNKIGIEGNDNNDGKLIIDIEKTVKLVNAMDQNLFVNKRQKKITN